LYLEHFAAPILLVDWLAHPDLDIFVLDTYRQLESKQRKGLWLKQQALHQVCQFHIRHQHLQGHQLACQLLILSHLVQQPLHQVPHQ
jgi:hypothetical protein